MRVRPLQTLWRQLLRLERPRQTPGLWRSREIAAVVLACALVALLASWPWLVEPSLQAGMAAPFTARAPKDARVIDSTALEERRDQMLHRTTVQVVDQEASSALMRQLQAKLQLVERQANSQGAEVQAIALSPQEQQWLEKLNGAQLGQWQRDVLQAQLRMLSQGLSASVAEGQLLEAANLQLESQSPPGRSLGARLLVSSLAGHANLRNDPTLSQRRIEALITQQGIPTIAVKAGDLITRQGQPITAQAFDVLDYFGLVNRRPRPLIWLAHFGESLAVCGVMLLAMRRWRPSLEPRQALLGLVGLLVVVGFSLWLGPLASPLVLLVPPTLLLAQGLGTSCGLAWLAAASLLWPVPLAGVVGTRLLVASGFAALAALAAGRQRNRAELLQLAVLLPSGALLVQWLLLTRSPVAQVDLPSEALLLGALLMGGLLIAPLVETFFGLLTRARLLELADLQRPLLRRLSCEAPGTFEHTLMIAGLAEEGARAIGADVDLVRTGAMYHDVGKLHGPQWFIENQGQEANPHDSLDDPFASAAILQAHVDEGLKLAKRYRLPKPLADFIPEHQGTLKMGYFLHQAREKNPAVPESRFRYRGPTPNSCETAILMLADGCEAALRSLPPGTSEAEARAMVRRLIGARLDDGQLASSGMGRAELELLIRAFVQVWKRMRHRRIPYPIPARKAFSA
ncbi:HDIG domain-containing metalloprotein [Cyanobium sp. WAJ14-Wanaka]|uniref:HDIG domain-containing metalloprotein n=1 Tax=Cyanobium sp. WAJ14-Wanaka TaxID=2823725 RepID=UPI0020CC1545|nr:HDIG domain-containing metalloprotein [Cyanobium sp. WAJ14-Wanaka]MCP9774206.1 HDIG domain-containing protein [Cyanobium sp. WAJ14-Wanaka]